MKPLREILPTYLDDMNSTLVQKAVLFQQKALVPLSSSNPITYYYMPKLVKGNNKRVAICAYC